ERDGGPVAADLPGGAEIVAERAALTGGREADGGGDAGLQVARVDVGLPIEVERPDVGRVSAEGHDVAVVADRAEEAPVVELASARRDADESHRRVAQRAHEDVRGAVRVAGDEIRSVRFENGETAVAADLRAIGFAVRRAGRRDVDAENAAAECA